MTKKRTTTTRTSTTRTTTAPTKAAPVKTTTPAKAAPAPKPNKPAKRAPKTTTPVSNNNSLLIGLIILIAIIVALLLWHPWTAAQPPAAAQPASSYPLAGTIYSSPQGHGYDATWTSDGRLWQPQLPEGNKRVAHTVAFTIEEGSYAFDGVECQLFVDPSRNGAGASNPVTAAFGNDLHFNVKTADGGQAWALVQCRGNASSGFQIRWLGK